MAFCTLQLQWMNWCLNMTEKWWGKRGFGVVIGVILLLAVSNYLIFQYALSRSIDLVDVPIASRTILPHQKITDSDYVMKQVPRVYVEKGVYLKKEEIVGKYVDLQSKVARGSMFYQDMVKGEQEIQELPALLLKPGQVAFPLSSDLLKSSGTTLAVNQKVDVYITYTDSKSKETTVDRLLQNVRIIGIKDRNGLSLTEEKAQRIPAVLVLAIQEDYVNYLKKASKMAVIDVLAPHVEYAFEEESMLDEECVLLELLGHE